MAVRGLLTIRSVAIQHFKTPVDFNNLLASRERLKILQTGSRDLHRLFIVFLTSFLSPPAEATGQPLRNALLPNYSRKQNPYNLLHPRKRSH